MTIASKQIGRSGAAEDALPLPEYPRPQMVRPRWLNLNGWWDFAVGDAFEPGAEAERILVPFAPESTLSGIDRQEFMNRVWYRREIVVPEEWAGDHVLLHFQAVDHDATVFLDGFRVGSHRGGFSAFSIDLGQITGAHDLVVRVEDSSEAVQARGKQSRRLDNYEAFYTRTTGIWQTVWIEPVPSTRLGRPRISPRATAQAFDIEVPITRPIAALSLAVTIWDDEGFVIDAAGLIDQTTPSIRVELPPARVRRWSTQDPFLYDLEIRLLDGDRVIDSLRTYAGLRSLHIEGNRILINGAPVFQRLVLDQGYYPDSLMTAPDDDSLVNDIRLAQLAGFNGARLHQKVFDERYLYHADKLGYLVWAEFGDWGANVDEAVGKQEPTISFITQWLEVMERDFSHPSIIGWCPLNETFQPLYPDATTLDDATRALYLATKLADATRPVLDASGYAHRVPGADVFDSHLYEQDPDAFAEKMGRLEVGQPYVNTAIDGTPWSVEYAGQPYFCSEFGGMWWSDDEEKSSQSWGYGDAPRTREEWWSRFERLTGALRENPHMFGYCFTQLTDVMQEKNGILRFDRTPKFDLELLRSIQTQQAAYERQ